jgi:hypothetical protein
MTHQIVDQCRSREFVPTPIRSDFGALDLAAGGHTPESLGVELEGTGGGLAAVIDRIGFDAVGLDGSALNGSIRDVVARRKWCGCSGLVPFQQGDTGGKLSDVLSPDRPVLDGVEFGVSLDRCD